MITLTWGQIREPKFNEVFGRILKTKMPLTTARRVQELVVKIQEEQKKLEGVWAPLSEHYLEPMAGSGGQVLVIKQALSQEEKDQAMKECDEFMRTLVEINLEPLSLRDLGNFQVSPEELLLLKGIIDAADESPN